MHLLQYKKWQTCRWKLKMHVQPHVKGKRIKINTSSDASRIKKKEELCMQWMWLTWKSATSCILSENGAELGGVVAAPGDK